VFAITEVGSRQYKVAEGEILLIPRIEKKKEVTLDKVLLITDSKDVIIGNPYIKGAKIVCEVLADAKGPKTIAFKFRRRKNSQRTIGHRDMLTKVKVKEIIKGE